ncbi:ABC transporter substrate-binding protein [Shouchella shacheensis]|uniref:ABC transporter substrate-binding protein n=1 Tax=Shouchella shacheensis TaxID=1649580 RepID=UPI00073FABDF|nr:sugar ABC transporter substrate-binding protein [Shouchella shacheensis]
MKKWVGKLGVVGCAVIITGCSGSGEGTSAEGEEVNLSFVSWGDPEELKVYQRAVDSFNEEHEGEIHVELSGLPTDNYTQILTTRLQGGQAPDVFYVQDFAMSTFIDTNSVLELNEFLESDESYVSIEDFPEDIWGPTDVDGTKYGLVPDANPFVMYYNNSVFEEVGVKSPQEYFDEGEWTWETLEEITDQFKEAGKHGYVQDGGPFGVNTWIYNNGGDFEKDGKVVVDTDEKTIEAIEFVSRMVQEGNFVFSGTLPQGQGRDAMFMSNQVALVGAGRWLTPMFSEAGLDFDYIPWPTNTENQMEPTLVTSGYIAANANTEHQEEAMKFISYYTSETGQDIRLSDNGNSIPSIDGLDHVVTDDPEPEHASYLLDALEIGRPIVYEFAIPGLSTDLEDIYELMFIGDITTDEAIKRLAETARESEEAQE